jgi:hypothetical protein
MYAFDEPRRDADDFGRGFTSDEAKPTSRVVVMSYALWLARYKGDRDIVGKQVSIDSQPHTVVGVLPPRYPWPIEHDPAQLIVPSRAAPTTWSGRKTAATIFCASSRGSSRV